MLVENRPWVAPYHCPRPHTLLSLGTVLGPGR
jgi:hypothetical protein